MSVLLPVLIAIPPLLSFVFETPLLQKLSALVQPRHDGSLHPIGRQAKRISSVTTTSLDRLLGTRSRDGSLPIANESHVSKTRDSQQSSGDLAVARGKRPFSRSMKVASSGVEPSGIQLADASSELEEQGDDEVRQIVGIMEQQHSMLRAAHAIRDLLKKGETGNEEQKEEWKQLREALALAQGDRGDWHGSAAGTLALSHAKWGSMKPENALANPVAAVGSSRRERALAVLPSSQPPDSATEKAVDPFLIHVLKFLRRRQHGEN